MPAHRYVEENVSAAILAAKRSAGVASEVNLGEHITHMPPPSAYIHTYITRSTKQGYQWPHKKDLYPPNFFLKN